MYDIHVLPDVKRVTHTPRTFFTNDNLRVDTLVSMKYVRVHLRGFLYPRTAKMFSDPKMPRIPGENTNP